MPQSPEEIHARVVAHVGEDGRLPVPPSNDWDIFPWEVVDGQIVTKVLRPPVAAEAPRWGEGDRPCGSCTGATDDLVIWRNDRWKVLRTEEPGGLLMLSLQPREHLDLDDLDDDLAGEMGRISLWLSRIVGRLPHVGRVHLAKWGDGGAHLHVFVLARPERLAQVIGSPAIEWADILPPMPEDLWRAELAEVARRLATHDGTALA